MRHFALIGNPLSHSFSADYFAQKFILERILDADYRLLPLESLGNLKSVVSEHDLKGFNVTIPFKIEIIPKLDELAASAQEIGAVNCVSISNGRFIGYNTDAFGFGKSLSQITNGRKINKALVFGSGGASRADHYVLNLLNVSTRVISRHGIDSYATLRPIDIQECDLLVNATPLGMFPHNSTFPPIAYEAIGSQHLVLDLVYNPQETLFMRKCSERGARVENGMTMLYAQAEKSWEIWNS